jgi:hypothetical protein
MFVIGSLFSDGHMRRGWWARRASQRDSVRMSVSWPVKKVNKNLYMYKF